MKLARKLNSKLAAATGFEVRRSGAPPRKRPRVAEEAPGQGASPQVAFRPPEDPDVDRLLNRPVFIISPVRSGSTLLRLLLNAHSRLHSPHELHVRRLEVRCGTRLAERSMEQLGLDRGDLEHLIWDRVMHRELVKSGKDFIVEKTPSNAFAYKRIAACWPDARFIFLLRHPASIATSWYEGDPEKRTEEDAALDALRYMRATERARKGLPGHTVRYEDLTADPEGALREICAFLDIDFEPGMLEYGSKRTGDLQKGLGDWKEKIRSGKVQAGRELPGADQIPEPLREISAAWGYTEDRAAAPQAGPGDGRPHAEIAEVWPRDGSIRVVGDIHGWPADPGDTPWQLLLTLRGDPKRRLSYTAPLVGRRFDVSIPVTDLARDLTALPAQWDIHLATDPGDGEKRLRAGRQLDGVKNKKEIMVFPSQPAPDGAADDTADDSGAILVQPYYTIKDNLSIECLAQQSEVQPAT